MDTLPPTPEALLVEPLLTCTAPPTPLAPIPSPPATVNKPAVPELLLPELTVTTPDTPLLAELRYTGPLPRVETDAAPLTTSILPPALLAALVAPAAILTSPPAPTTPPPTDREIEPPAPALVDAPVDTVIEPLEPEDAAPDAIVTAPLDFVAVGNVPNAPEVNSTDPLMLLGSATSTGIATVAAGHGYLATSA
ncbi:hypothetical protein PC120_g27932 [Phytophthora cactorum]|nr:hypothetical protein PC120_g27932 [Phytophthora cactorum]